MEIVALLVGPLGGVIMAPLMLVVLLVATLGRPKRPLWIGLGLCGIVALMHWSYWSAFWSTFGHLDAGREPPARTELVEALSLYGSALAVIALVALGIVTSVRRPTTP